MTKTISLKNKKTILTSTFVMAVLVGGLISPQLAHANEIAIMVDLDIKPGSDPNTINSRSMGLVPVAILGSADFDIADVDITTVTFGPGAAVPVHDGHFEDVNGDGIIDLVFHFAQKDTGLSPGDTEADLIGSTLDGTDFCGMDAVVVK